MTKRRAKAGKSPTKRKPSTGSRAAARSLVERLKAHGFVVYKRGKKKRHQVAMKAAKTRAEAPPKLGRELGQVVGELLVFETTDPLVAEPALSRLDRLKERPPIWKADLVALRDGDIVAQEQVETTFALEDESEGTNLRRSWRDWLDRVKAEHMGGDETPAVGLVRLAVLPPARGEA